MHCSRMRTVRCSDRRGVSAQGVSAQGGVSAKAGVSAKGECLPTGGMVSAQGGKGVSAQRGYLPRGGCIPACTEADTPPLWTE